MRHDFGLQGWRMPQFGFWCRNLDCGWTAAVSERRGEKFTVSAYRLYDVRSAAETYATLEEAQEAAEKFAAALGAPKDGPQEVGRLRAEAEAKVPRSSEYY
jgi:hypothetical protein